MMAKYRKRPVVIEAEQYVEYGKLVRGMCNSTACFSAGNEKPHVHTIHKVQIVNLEEGDWVIPEPDGLHYYPVKPDIFEATYEKVQEETRRAVLTTTPEDLARGNYDVTAVFKNDKEEAEYFRQRRSKHK